MNRVARSLTVHPTAGAIGSLAHLMAPAVARPLSLSQSYVLVVDDEVISRNAFINILKYFGYRTYEASTMAEAIAVCRHPGIIIDLLLADFKLAEATGVDVAIRVRRLFQGIPVLFTSGTPIGDWEPFERARVSAMGGLIGFLPKPFSMSALDQGIRALTIPV